MSSVLSVVTRLLITLIHVSIGVAAGIGVIYTLARWGTLEGCLPPMAQLQGGTFTMKTQLPDLCDCIFIAMCVIAFINLTMCAFVNCLWKYKSSSFLLLNLFITLAVAGFCVFVASLMTTYQMIWCDVIVQRMSNHLDISCSTAATHYAKMTGSTNMTGYYNRIQVQVLGLWAIVPLTIVIIFLYGVAVNIERSTHPTNIEMTEDREANSFPPPTPPATPPHEGRFQYPHPPSNPSPAPPPPPTAHSPPYHDDGNPFTSQDETTPLLLNSDPSGAKGYTKLD